ncbi:MAG: adenosine deaminase [Spirochaetota bacterium]
MVKKQLAEKSKNKLLDKEIMRHFPKIELHRHLEGSFPVKDLFDLSLKNDLNTPKDLLAFKTTVQFPKDSKPDFLLFLSKFNNTWYRTYDDVYYITYSSVRNLVKDGLFYIELRFSPEHFSLHNNFDRQEITRLIIEAGNDAAKEINLKIKYLITFTRNKQSQDDMIELYNKIKMLYLNDIIGVDLAGDEINYPPVMFTTLFSRIKKDGIYKVTIHAGEVSTSEQIWEAIKKLYALRIGHGTSTIYDPALQEFLIERGIILEQCITSNFQTGAWEDERNHPIGKLYYRGVPVTINSDDPTIQNTDLTDDYIKAIDYFNFSFEDLVKLNLTALKGSFLQEKEKQELITSYQIALSRFKEQFLL